MEVAERVQSLLLRAEEYWYLTACYLNGAGNIASIKPEYLAWKAEAGSLISQTVGPDHPIYQLYLQCDTTAVLGKPTSAFDASHAHILAALLSLQTELNSGLREVIIPDGHIEASARVRQICQRFHHFAHSLRSRYDNRPSILIKDEYDVQDLLGALLRIDFQDVRSEEWTPSYAGSSTRMDFLIKSTGIVVEVKKTRQNLGDKQIGQELLIDAAHYRQHPDCTHLICFIYDPHDLISNPAGLAGDIQQQSDARMAVEVVYSPNR